MKANKIKRTYAILHDICWYFIICLLLFIFLPDLHISPFIHGELRTLKRFPMLLTDAMMFAIVGDTWLFFNKIFIRRNFVLKNPYEFRIIFCSSINRSPTAVCLAYWEEIWHYNANFSVSMFSQAWTSWSGVGEGPQKLMLKLLLKYKQETLNSP